MSSEFLVPETAGSPGQPFETYQFEAYDALEAARQSGMRRVNLDMATGCGKSRIIAEDIARFLERNPGERVLSLCHNTFILQQNRDEILAATGITSHGHMFGGEFQDQEQLVSATFQTMSRPLGGGKVYQAFDPKEFGYVWIDESHHGPADTYEPVIDWFQPDYCMAGTTATAERRDQRDVEKVIGPTVYRLPLEEAIAKGYLARPDYRVLTDQLKRIDHTGLNPKDVEQINGLVFVPKRDQEIVDTIIRHLEEIDDPHTIVFCASIDHAEHFSQLFPAGTAAALHSGLTGEEQEDRLKGFKKGDIPTLLVVDMLNEGVDMPKINAVAFLRSTESKTVFFQQLGRGLRKVDGKESVLVMDFVANWGRLNTLHSLQTGIQSYRDRRKVEPRQAWEVEVPDIKFNFSSEAMEAVEAIQEARERTRVEKSKPKPTPRLDKWALEAAELKEMLGIENLPRQGVNTGEWRRFEERLGAGDPSVEEEILLRNLRQIYGTSKWFAEKLASDELALEDHFQHAVTGAVDAIRSYDPKKHKSLRDQIVFYVYRKLGSEAGKRGLIKLPQSYYDRLRRLEKARTKLAEKIGDIALADDMAELDNEVADISGIDPEEIAQHRWLQQTVNYDSLLPIGEEAEYIPDSPEDQPDEAMYTIEMQALLRQVLEELSYRERRVLELRWGLARPKSLNLLETAQEFNVTQERIRFIENQALKKLKRVPSAQPLRAELPDFQNPSPARRRQNELKKQRQRFQQETSRLPHSSFSEPAQDIVSLITGKGIDGLRYSRRSLAVLAGMAFDELHSQRLSRDLSRRPPYLRTGETVITPTEDKHELLARMDKYLAIHLTLAMNRMRINYADYIRALHELERHGIVEITRNDRGTIIESVRLTDEWAAINVPIE